MGSQDQPNREALAELDRVLFETYQHRCVGCFINEAVTIHELEPKSKRPNDWWLPSNRVPLCDRCHRPAHRQTRSSAVFLRKQRERLLGLIYG